MARGAWRTAHREARLYADFTAPWQGPAQTALSATLVDTPPDAAMAEADTLIVLPE